MPNIVHDLVDAAYHADPALSCSNAKLLLSCPAKLRYRLDTGQEHKDAFDVGKAAHKLILGVGEPVVIIDADDWRTKDAQAAKKAAHADGAIPVLRKDWVRVEMMAGAVRGHQTANALLSDGDPEVSLFWTCPDAGVDLRARLDWLRRGRPIIVDVKTTTDASPGAFAKAIANYRYHMQAAWYQDGVRAVHGLDGYPPFVFVAVEKDPPHLVGVYELDGDALAAGRRRMRNAIDLWRRCVDRDEWPAYEAAVLTLPRWAAYQSEEDQ